MDKKDFGELVNAAAPTLYRVAKSFLKNDADCEDAAQEAVAIAFSKLASLKNDQYAKTWLVRILMNECRRTLRMRKRVVPSGNIDAGHTPEDQSGLYEALMGLELKFRTPIVLHYLEGFSVGEISAMLKVPPGTVKSRLARARQKLRTLLHNLEDIDYERI